MTAKARFRPSRRAIALEPRLLFDGAGAVAAVDGFADGWGDPDFPDEAPAADASPSDDAPATLVIIDARVADHEILSADLPANIVVRVIGEDESGLAVTGEALANGHNGQGFDAIHIVSHGTPGSLTLGNDTINNETLSAHSEQLQSWALHLTMDADILLYGCDIAAGDEGEAFITELAHLTEADIAASIDPTGASDQGGNWTLESQTGPIEAGILFSEAAMAGFGGLLDATDTAKPEVKIELDNQHILIGEDFTFELQFNNAGNHTGYGPYIDLYLPKGIDGDDGISIADTGAIKYLGQDVIYNIYTVGDDHPYAKDENGNAIKITGDEEGGKVVVIELPFGSYTVDQPQASLMVTATLHEFADVGEGKNLTIKANTGFRYGNTPVEDYATDPSIVGTEFSLEVIPAVVEYEFDYNGPEHETASGPNFPRSVTTTIKVADGQELTDYTFVMDVPDNVVVTGYTIGDSTRVDVDGGTISDGKFTHDFHKISGTQTITLHYYVPEFDSSNDDPILDPTQGNTVKAEFNVSGSGNWRPLDIRDQQQTVEFDPEGVEIEHTIKPLAIQKDVEIGTDTGKPGATPGDTLKYTIDFQVSDYFSFNDIVITDTLNDGHEGLENVTLTITHQGQPVELTLSADDWVTSDPSEGGKTTITFNVSQALEKAVLSGVLAQGIMQGGKYNGADLGRTTGTITYNTTITDKYTVKGGPAQIHQNDKLESGIKIEGTIVPVESEETGERINDDSVTEIGMAGGGLTLEVAKVNGEDVQEGGIKPGDEVTYELTYDLSTGDYKDLVLDAYLPMPVFHVGDVWAQVNTEEWPDAGQWQLVTDLDGVEDPTVTVDTANNKLSFDFGDRDDPENNPATITLRFTVQVSDDPFADNLFLTAQAQASDKNTETEKAVQQDIDQIRLNQPVLTVQHGIVSNTEQGTINGTSGTWTDPGSSGQPFTGPITDITGIDGNLTGFDAGDRVVFALGIQNTGGSAAYDVTTTEINAPAGFSFAKADGTETDNLADANLKVYRGDGTLLVADTDYTVDENGTITFTNTSHGVIGAARDSGGNAISNGSNIIIITYDAVAKDDVIAGAETTSTTGVESYTSVAGSENDFLPGEQKITDDAKAATAQPEVKIVFKDGTISADDTTADHTDGANVVIGEAVYYDIVVTLPEGETHDLQVSLDVPPGMKLDTNFSDDGFTGGYKVISEAGTETDRSDALSDNFAGNLGTHTVTGNDGEPGQDPRFTFEQITTKHGATNDNSFVIRVRLVADNVATNKQGTKLSPDVSVTYDKGGANTNTKIESTSNDTTVTVREPKLTIEKVVDTNPDVEGTQGDAIDAGDTITYTITIKNESGVDAFDLNFKDDFAGMLDGLGSTWTAMKLTGGEPEDIKEFFEWTGTDDRTLQIKSGANLDLEDNEQIVITVTATTNTSAAAVSSFDSDAIVTWSSINSDNNSDGKRDPNERYGTPEDNLNDYIAKDNAEVKIVSNNTLSRVGGLEDTYTDKDTAEGEAKQAIGEIVRFRMVIQVPEGEIPDMSVHLNLPDGYQYLGEAMIALIADQGLTASELSSDDITLSPGNGDLTGNIDSDLNTGNHQTRASGTYPGNVIVAEVGEDGKPIFKFGTVKNSDDDANAEYIVIEFNAIVANTADNTAGTKLETSFVVKSGDTELGTSNTTTDTLIEPQLSDIDKKVIGMEGDDTTRTLTVSNSFDVGNETHNGSAYDITLTDHFPQGSNYAFAELTVGETTYKSFDDANEVDGINIKVNDDNSITVTFDKLEPGTNIELQYKVDVPVDEAQDPDNAKATLTWSSLPGDSGEFEFIGSSAGDAGTPNGERDDSGVGATPSSDAHNNYKTSGTAGYGVISGTLWDDTINQDGEIDDNELLLEGVTVTITWAGPDGVFGGDDSDDVTFTTTTDEHGYYSFGGLPEGQYKIEGQEEFSQTYSNDDAVKFDTDLLTPRSDPDGNANGVGTFIVTLGDGATTVKQDIGYLQVNDKPEFENVGNDSIEYTEGVNTPEDQDVLGTPVHLAPDGEIYDPELVDHGLDDFGGTTLIVGRSDGNDGFSPHSDDVLGFDFGVDSGLTLEGSDIRHEGTVIGTVDNGTDGQLTITFTSEATPETVNNVLQAITYANSSDTPDETVNIRFRFNDNNQDDAQGSGGALYNDAVVTVNITPKNDPPIAADDSNEMPNTNNEVTGNVISGIHQKPDSDDDRDSVSGEDGDVDTPVEQLKISGIQSIDADGHLIGDGPSEVVDSTTTVINGLYGKLIIDHEGNYIYELNHDNHFVYGLVDGGKLEDKFEYTLSDGHETEEGEDTATLTITITGTEPKAPSITPRDDNDPDSPSDPLTTGHATVYESGLENGTNPKSGSHIHNNGEIDVTIPSGLKTLEIGNSEPFTLDDLRNATPEKPLEIQTDYGTLTVTNANFQGDPEAPRNVTLTYTYTLTNVGDNDKSKGLDHGISDDIVLHAIDVNDIDTTGTLTIYIVDDKPLATPDINELIIGDQEKISGNVFENDKIGADGTATNGPVTGISKGNVDTPADGVNTPTDGEFGHITIQPDGSYIYDLDPENDAVKDLQGGETLEEIFTYTITDSDGDRSTATLTITIHGNHPPAANPDVKEIPEDSVGTGNILTNDTDDDRDPLKVTGFTIEGGGNDPHIPGIPVDIPGVGTITIDEDGNYTFTPVKDWNGDVPVITYTVTDGKGGTAESTLTITVTPVPDAVDDTTSTESGMPVTLDPLANDKFSNPDAKVTDVTPGHNGKVTITPDGRVTYTPDPGFEGTDTFTYTVISGGITETATVTVTVRGQHVDVPPPAFGDYTPPSQVSGTPGSPMTRDVVRDTSVYFHDESFDRVDRMQLPFHPVTYVNRQVQMSQDERAGSDARFHSNPAMINRGDIQSPSIGAGLGADPNLFVQHTVRDTQTRADFLSRVVDGRLGRVSLSSDQALPSPDLFQADISKFIPTATRPDGQPDAQSDPQADAGESPDTAVPADGDAAQEAGDPQDASDTASDEQAMLDALAGIAGLDTQADEVALAATGAPSFTEQLKGGSARLPATLFSPHKAV